jgi:uncharacterized protein YdaU (DUF1376 family)
LAEFPQLPIWTDALLGDTAHLSPAEFGAYMRLLIAAWRRPGCDLPGDDDLALGRIVGDTRNWQRLRVVVMAFWTKGEDGRYRQKRLSEERAKAVTYRKSQSEKATQRWRQAPKNVRQNPPQGGTPNPSHDTASNPAQTLNNADTGACAQPMLPTPIQKETGVTDTSTGDNLSKENLIQPVVADFAKSAKPAATPKQEDFHPALEPRNGTEHHAPNGHAKPAAKGSRWPAHARVPATWLSEAVQLRAAQHLDAIDLRVEAEKFSLHFTAKAGSEALSTDWHQRFLLWALNANAPRGTRIAAKVLLPTPR